MRYIVPCLLFILFSVACAGPTTPEKAAPALAPVPLFTVNDRQQAVSKPIYNMIYFRGHYLIVNTYGQWTLLDSLFRRMPAVEQRLNDHHITNLINLGDTLLQVGFRHDERPRELWLSDSFTILTKSSSNIFAPHTETGLANEEDSLKELRNRSQKELAGLIRKGNDRILYSFVQNDTLFAILTSDSSTYIAMQLGDTLKKIQPIRNKRTSVKFYRETRFNNTHAAYLEYWTFYENDTAQITESSSALIVIRGKHIEMIEYPYKQAIKPPTIE